MEVFLANVAIVVGNSEYERLAPLVCCCEDVIAVKELLNATEKFDTVEVVLNTDSSCIKERIRSTIDAHGSIKEVFFYFTGHGFQHHSEFFFCASNFDSKRPNETGLSNSELHTLLRSTDADLVVKVIDACNSGTLLIKQDASFLAAEKQGFKNLIQIASCLDSQSSLTGDPLSLFTEKFRTAALRKIDGVVYYTDIIDTLRDEFLDDEGQTPHFVSQWTGREQFVDTAKKFDSLRAKLANAHANAGDAVDVVLVEPVVSVTEMLGRAGANFATRQGVQDFIGVFFDELKRSLSADDELSGLFTTEVIEHADFQEATTRGFIINVLWREKRPDNFVSVELRNRNRDPLGLSSAFSFFVPELDHILYDLRVNCSLDRTQLKITLTPKFVALKRFVLVVSCAPSLETCYVFEMLTQHALRDWDAFEPEGTEIVRRWYKMKWTNSPEGLANGISRKLKEMILESVDAILKARS